jgi:hypothetical protein
MSWTTAIIDGLANTYQYGIEKFRTPRKTPRHVGAEVMDAPLGVPHEFWGELSDDKKQALAARVSWIYSNIIRIANEVSASEFQVTKKNSNEKDIDHPFERIMLEPNEWFSGIDLLQYVVWGLSLDTWGAFWFLSPDRQTGELKEIWPMPLGTTKPVKDKNKFIKGYLYTPRKNKGESFLIKPEFICRFIYAHPHDLWKSFPPLEASTLAIDTYQGIARTQRDLFTQSRGIPLSVLSLDENISEPDFATARQRIRDDWESERKIAIIRGGTMDIQTVGLSNQQLQVIQSHEFNRDEIDAIYMGGIQWRSADISGQERDEINKEIKEVVIHPLHKLIAAKVQINVINRFYTPDFIGGFEDVRAQDRAILLQERNIYFRSHTFDEARAALNLPPVNNPDLPDYGELPYPLATNSSFVAGYYGISDLRDPQENVADVGNLPESRDETAQVNQLAEAGQQETGIDLKTAISDGVKEELKRYRKVLIRTYRKHNTVKSIIERKFDTSIIFPEIMSEIQEELLNVQSESDIAEIFSRWL